MKLERDPIFYFRGFRRWSARDNGMKLLNFRYSKICSSRLSAGEKNYLSFAKVITSGKKDPNFFASSKKNWSCAITSIGPNLAQQACKPVTFVTGFLLYLFTENFFMVSPFLGALREDTTNRINKTLTDL
jgi:hypothetical protein